MYFVYRFPSGICLIYEYIGKRDAVKDVINLCETKLKAVFENRKDHRFVCKSRLAFVYLLQGCKAYFQYYYGDANTVQDVSSNSCLHNSISRHPHQSHFVYFPVCSLFSHLLFHVFNFHLSINYNLFLNVNIKILNCSLSGQWDYTVLM